MNTPIPDSERIAVLAAEREVSAVETLILHTADLSDLAKESAIRRLNVVRQTLQSFRARFGLAI